MDVAVWLDAGGRSDTATLPEIGVVSRIDQPGARQESRRSEVRALGRLDYLPPERLQGDVLPGSELAEQVRHRPAPQAGRDVVEDGGRIQAQLLGDYVVQGQADHHVARVTFVPGLRDPGSQQGRPQDFGGSCP